MFSVAMRRWSCLADTLGIHPLSPPHAQKILEVAHNQGTRRAVQQEISLLRVRVRTSIFWNNQVLSWLPAYAGLKLHLL